VSTVLVAMQMTRSLRLTVEWNGPPSKAESTCPSCWLGGLSLSAWGHGVLFFQEHYDDRATIVCAPSLDGFKSCSLGAFRGG